MKEDTHLVCFLQSSRKKGIAYLAQGPTYGTPNKYLGDGSEAEGVSECTQGQRETLISDIDTCVSYEGIATGTQKMLGSKTQSCDYLTKQGLNTSSHG